MIIINIKRISTLLLLRRFFFFYIYILGITHYVLLPGDGNRASLVPVKKKNKKCLVAEEKRRATNLTSLFGFPPR